MRKLLLSLCVTAGLASAAGSARAADEEPTGEKLAVRNMERAIELVDGVMRKCFYANTMHMGDIYNYSTGKAEGTADVWPYTAAIEAVNSVLEGLEAVKKADPALYEDTRDRYVALLESLYNGIGYYTGSYNLTSYTRSAYRWTVYGVHRGSAPGKAPVEGIENVYDDQMWIVRELIRAYRNTGRENYLKKAEYLTEYVLDGWDCVPDAGGNEYGGITWGPGYNSKHSCSNGPIVAPLVWLAEMYKGKPDKTFNYYVDIDGTRGKEEVTKHDYYLGFAKKVYQWQKNKLLNKQTGVYWDMLGADNTIKYEEIDGVSYRRHTDTGGPTGTAFTYNTGTMLSGAVDLYRATSDEAYSSDVTGLSKDSRYAFCKTRTVGGEKQQYFPYDNSTTSGFNAWFDDVLMRAYVEASPLDKQGNADYCLGVFQRNLDYAYKNHLREGFLPNDLLGGWSYTENGVTRKNNSTKGFHQLAYASEYAMLAVHIMPGGGGSTDIRNFKQETAPAKVDVYDTDGRMVRGGVSRTDALEGLRDGVYIVGGQKFAVKSDK